MRYALPLVILALLLPAGLAMARPSAGQVILSGCRQGECAWYRVVRVEAPVALPGGALRRMVVRGGRSVHLDGNLPNRARDARIEWEAANRVDYAFCSTRRPAYAFGDDDGDLTVHFLNLFSLAGYQEASGRAYMRLCHGRDRVPGARDLRRLGYRPGARSEQVEAATPETMTRF